MKAQKQILFERRLAGGETGKLGTAVQYEGRGWRFFPNNQHKPSRKFHPTLEACLPRWVGYPNQCQSHEVFSGAPSA